MPTPQPLIADMVIHGRYQIIRPVGSGGMGAVYEALDTRLGARVALKWLQPPPGVSELQTRVLLRAFEREARILARLRHAALPGVTDFFGDDAGQYLVLQYIPGDDLAELLAERGVPFALEQVLEWADALLDALEYLHSRRPPILHRDIKPQNLKLTPGGEIVLLDFGLARGAGEIGWSGSDGASLVAYTPQYAPIEQIRGAAPDVRSDLYALAATLHHLLTGELPPGAVVRMQALLEGRPDPLRPAYELNPAVPRAVGAALVRALAPLVEDRPYSAALLRAQLRAARQNYDPQRSTGARGSGQAAKRAGLLPTTAFPRTRVLWEEAAGHVPGYRTRWQIVRRSCERRLTQLRRSWFQALGIGSG
jgi:eukaryotic-like serine/threonine-protein kinase